MTPRWAAELAFAEHLADVADAISVHHFRRSDTAVRVKADGTPVTEADEAIERALRSEIAAAYPEHGVLGEEEGSTGEGPARWIIDPIDGTKSFSWGIPVWATLIALEVEAEIVCGVVSAPALGDRWTAVRAAGARRNGELIGVSDVGSLDRARLGFTSATSGDAGFRESFQRLLRSVAHNRGLGDFYGHVLVASGSLDVMIEPHLSPWDIGPLIVIVEEAGGRLTDFSGRAQIYGGSCLTTNGSVHDEALALLSGTGL
ncbi:MAG: inositol monophosphatase family protein [Actinomycetota bacterium]